MKRSIYIIMFALTFASLAAAAEPATFPEAKLQITYPAGWKAKTTEKGPTILSTPADDGGIMVWAHKSLAPDTVEKEVAQVLKSLHGTDAKWDTQVHQQKVNGLPAFGRVGTATIDGKPHELATIVVMNGADGLILLAIMRSDNAKSHAAALADTVGSIKPVK